MSNPCFINNKFSPLYTPINWWMFMEEKVIKMLTTCSLRISQNYELVLSFFLSDFQKARTSGFLVVVGVSSYLAYRLCVKYFGQEFFSSFLAHAKSLIRDDNSTCSLVGQPFQYKEEYDILADDEWSSEGEEDSDQEVASQDTGTTFLPKNDLIGGKFSRRGASPCLRINGSPLSSRNATYPRPRYRKSISQNSTPLRKRTSPALSGESPKRRCSLPQSPLCSNKTKSHPHRTRCSPQKHFDQSALGSETSSQSSFAADSPPPIRRKRPQTLPHLGQNGGGEEVRSLASSCPSSASTAQQFIWEPICTPGTANLEESLSCFLLSGQELDPEKLAAKVLSNLSRRENAKSPAPSEMSCFSEVSTAGIRNIGLSTAQSLERLTSDIRQLKDGLDDLNVDLSDLLERSHCKGDSKHLYRSVVVAPSELGSEIGSIRSLEIPSVAATSHDGSSFGGNSNFRAYPSTKFRSRAGSLELNSTGELLESQSLKTCGGSLRNFDSATTENGNRRVLTKIENCPPRKLSALSRDSQFSTDFTPSPDCNNFPLVKSENSESQGLFRGKLLPKFVDSAICTDIGSSDSNSEAGGAIWDPSSWLSKSRLFASNLGVTPEEQISSCSYRQESLGSESLWEENSQALSLEWDEMKLRSAGATTASSFVADSCEGDLQIDSGQQSGPSCLGPDSVCRGSPQLPRGNRDLMVFARENYFANTAIMKVLHQLYKKRRLRRTLELRPSLYAPVQACILSILRQGFPIFKCQSFKVVSEHENYNKMQLESGNIEQQLGIQADLIGPTVLEAVKLLMVLKALEVYDHTLYTRYPCRPFYADLFLRETPKDILKNLTSAGWQRTFTDMELALMAEALGIRLEIFRVNSCRPHVAAVYPDATVTSSAVTLLQLNSELAFMPLFHSNDQQ